jgi:hypothetical protein
VIADAFAIKLAAGSHHARVPVAAWNRSKDEWLGRAANILAKLASRDAVLPDEQLTRETERHRVDGPRVAQLHASRDEHRDNVATATRDPPSRYS